MQIKIKKKRLFTFVVFILICYVIYTSYDIYSYGNVNEMDKRDAAIVLGAATWGDKLSPVFEERIKHGIWLYKNGYVDKLIFTGGKSEGMKYSEANIARNYAIENLIPIEDIYIEEKSTITQENISYAAQIIEKNNISTVILVSDPLHMKRTMLMAKDYGLQAYSSPTPTTRYITLKSKVTFLAREVFFYVGYRIYRLL